MRRAAALTALVIAFGPAASPASAQDSARGSGTYQFEPGRSYGLGTVRFNARGTATEATGSISIRIPDYPDDEWNQTVRARVTCINARGNLAVIAGRITKIREQYAEDLRYFRLVVRDGPDGVDAGMNPTPFSCSDGDVCFAGGCLLGSLVRGSGVVVRDRAAVFRVTGRRGLIAYLWTKPKRSAFRASRP